MSSAASSLTILGCGQGLDEGTWDSSGAGQLPQVHTSAPCADSIMILMPTNAACDALQARINNKTHLLATFRRSNPDTNPLDSFSTPRATMLGRRQSCEG